LCDFNALTLGRVVLFAEQKGIPSANFSKKAEGSPLNSKIIENIFVKFPDISLEWLLTGKGEMMRNEQKIGDISKSTVVGNNVSGHAVNINHTISSETIAENSKYYHEIIS